MSHTLKQTTGGLRLTRQFTVTVAALAAAVGIIILILGSNFRIAWVEAIGSTILSIGVVTLVTEYFLRSIFTHELLGLVELRESILNSGFIEASIEGQVQWNQLYTSARRMRLVLPDPRGWMSREWPLVLEAAQKRACDIEIYLPDDKCDLMVDFGRMTLGIERADYVSALGSAERKIGATWTAGGVAEGSQISVFRLTEPAGYGIVGFDDSLAFILPTIGGGAGVHNLAIRFATESDNAVQKWAREALSDLDRQEYSLYYESKPEPKLTSTEGTK